MSQKFKRLRSQIQNKIQPEQIKNIKSDKKIPLNTKIQKQMILQAYKLKQKPIQQRMKLNRIQSQYIKSTKSQSLPKTPKISKLSSNKLTVQVIKPQKKTIKKEKNISQNTLNHKIQKNQNAKQIVIQNTKKKQTYIKNKVQQFVKKSLKTSHISNKSLTIGQNQSFLKNDYLASINLNQKSIKSKSVSMKQKSGNLKEKSTNLKQKPFTIVKQKAYLKKNNYNSKNLIGKKLSKQQFQEIKLCSKIKSPQLKKISSTCSVKKYYILNKSKDKQMLKQTTHLPLTTYRGFSNPEDNLSYNGRRSFYANTMKIYNSSTDLNNTTKSSERQRQMLERVQRALEYYRTNLDQEKQKRRSLQLQNQILKEQLMKTIRLSK